MFVYTTVLYKYMKLLRNYVQNQSSQGLNIKTTDVTEREPIIISNED